MRSIPESLENFPCLKNYKSSKPAITEEIVQGFLNAAHAQKKLIECTTIHAYIHAYSKNIIEGYQFYRTKKGIKIFSSFEQPLESSQTGAPDHPHDVMMQYAENGTFKDEYTFCMFCKYFDSHMKRKMIINCQTSVPAHFFNNFLASINCLKD